MPILYNVFKNPIIKILQKLSHPINLKIDRFKLNIEYIVYDNSFNNKLITISCLTESLTGNLTDILDICKCYHWFFY